MTPGAIALYPRAQLDKEVAYIAYHFHWPLDQILDLEHGERQTWLREISWINQEINEARRG